MVCRKDFLHLFYTKTISFFQEVIAKLYRCQQDKLKRWKPAISFLYQKREMLYLYYICLGENYITAISFWGMLNDRPQKDIEQSYHCPISGYITFAESSTTVLYPVGYWHKQIRHQIDFFADDSFYCRRISQTCHFLPWEKFPVKPSAFESEIHPSHKSEICTPGISPLQGANSRKRELQMLTHLSSARNGTGFVNGHLSVHTGGGVLCAEKFFYPDV